jgi:hypothetical protein
MSSRPLQRQQTHTSSFKVTRALNRRDGIDTFGSIGPHYPRELGLSCFTFLLAMQTRR